MSGPKLFSDGCDKMRGACQQQQCPAWPNKSRAHMEAVSTARLAVCARDPSAQLIRPADRALMPIPTSCPSDMIHRRYSIDRMVLCLVCVHACMQCMHALVPRPLQPASQLYMPMPACLPLVFIMQVERARAYLQFIPPGGRARTKRGSRSIVSLCWMDVCVRPGRYVYVTEAATIRRKRPERERDENLATARGPCM